MAARPRGATGTARRSRTWPRTTCPPPTTEELPGPNQPAQADLLLVNANVLTMDPARPRARSVAIAGGRIIALDPGPADPPAREVADLAGATVLPGVHDAHNHMAWFGLTLSEADLRPTVTRTLAELYAAVTRQAEATANDTPGGDWVIGAGYD